MPYSQVPRITLNQDGTVTLYVTVYNFDEGTPIEISGNATQTNGAIATFYSVQLMPAGGEQGVELQLPPVAAVPPNNFAAGFPITVVARAAQAWVTTLEADQGSEDSQVSGPSGPSGVSRARSVAADPVALSTSKAAWKANSFNWAVAPPAQQIPPATTLIHHGKWWDRVKDDPPDVVLRGRGFRFREVPSATKVSDRVSSAPSLGPLAAFTGTFHGSGFNTIFRPDLGSPTSLPVPAADDNLLELNLTQETLSFLAALGSVPNRGEVMPDIFLNGVPYLQVINDVTIPGQPVGIHFEPGLWMAVPATTHPAEGPTIFRMGSIPHGTTIEAQGTWTTINGKPTIAAVDITPFDIHPPHTKHTFPSQTAADKTTARIPQDLTSFIAAGTITQAMLTDPNTFLRDHIASQTITSTTVINISTRPTAPLFGGGTNNIAFLLGDPAGKNPNANAVHMQAVFWIETVQFTLEVPIFEPGQPPLFIPAQTGAAEQPVPVFQVNPPPAITAPRSIKVTAPQIQYSQRVLLNFNTLSCPHVSVATLVPSSPLPVPASAFA